MLWLTSYKPSDVCVYSLPERFDDPKITAKWRKEAVFRSACVAFALAVDLHPDHLSEALRIAYRSGAGISLNVSPGIQFAAKKLKVDQALLRDWVEKTEPYAHDEWFPLLYLNLLVELGELPSDWRPGQ